MMNNDASLWFGLNTLLLYNREKEFGISLKFLEVNNYKSPKNFKKNEVICVGKVKKLENRIASTKKQEKMVDEKKINQRQ